MRGASRRSWVKFFTTGWLHGSIRWQLESDERGVWADLICLAGECGHEGEVSDNDGRAYPRTFIANQLNIPIELLDRTIAKCRREGRLADDDERIIISNWSSYQSEYDRQKKYRQADKYEGIFNTWNEQHIIVHKDMTDKIRQALSSVLSEYTALDISQSIKNYGEIISGNGYYFDYKWTLPDFLKRGIDKFMDIEVARQNYRLKDDKEVKLPKHGW